MNQNITIEPYHDIPYLLTVHNTSYVENTANYKHKKEHIAFQKKLDRSTAITYISNYAKTSTHKYFKVPKVNEYVIYNGNPVTQITLKQDYAPHFKTKGKFLFTIGEITERKNFNSLINLLRIVTDYELIIAGKKETRAAKEIENLIIKYQLTDRIHLVGKISEIDKQYYYNNCSAFLFPSLREGFGLPVIEAMKFGKPVFISNNTSLPEIGGKHAFYWDHYDPDYMAEIFNSGMQSYLNNQDIFSKNLIKRANSFNWEESAKAYIEVYKSLVNL
jgi:glycosyltransferase involved in cell wall biosynthesis